MGAPEARPVGVVLRFIAALLLFVAVSCGADWALRAENFPVRNVRFEGPFRHVTQAELERATMGLVRGNFFLVDLDAVQRRVEALPWVYRASVRRVFPHDIAIRFHEQRLAARWGEDAWLNVHGQVVRVHGPDLPQNAPRLDGPDGTSAQVYAHYLEFRARFAPAGLRLAGLTLSARRTWRVILRPPGGGQRRLTLVVDHAHAVPRLARFIRVYAGALAPRAGDIERVDLRYTNGFAVQWYPGAAHARFARAGG